MYIPHAIMASSGASSDIESPPEKKRDIVSRGKRRGGHNQWLDPRSKKGMPITTRKRLLAQAQEQSVRCE